MDVLLTPEDAERLIWDVKGGEYTHLGIVDAQAIELADINQPSLRYNQREPGTLEPTTTRWRVRNVMLVAFIVMLAVMLAVMLVVLSAAWLLGMLLVQILGIN